MKTSRNQSEFKIAELYKELREMAYREMELEADKYSEWSEWDRNIGECPKWFYGICEHSEYGETVCNHCKRDWSEE